MSGDIPLKLKWFKSKYLFLCIIWITYCCMEISECKFQRVGPHLKRLQKLEEINQYLQEQFEKYVDRSHPDRNASLMQAFVRQKGVIRFGSLGENFSDIEHHIQLGDNHKISVGFSYIFLDKLQLTKDTQFKVTRFSHIMKRMRQMITLNLHDLTLEGHHQKAAFKYFNPNKVIMQQSNGRRTRIKLTNVTYDIQTMLEPIAGVTLRVTDVISRLRIKGNTIIQVFDGSGKLTEEHVLKPEESGIPLSFVRDFLMCLCEDEPPASGNPGAEQSAASAARHKFQNYVWRMLPAGSILVQIREALDNWITRYMDMLLKEFIKFNEWEGRTVMLIRQYSMFVKKRQFEYDQIMDRYQRYLSNEGRQLYKKIQLPKFSIQHQNGAVLMFTSGFLIGLNTFTRKTRTSAVDTNDTIHLSARLGIGSLKAVYSYEAVLTETKHLIMEGTVAVDLSPMRLRVNLHVDRARSAVRSETTEVITYGNSAVTVTGPLSRRLAGIRHMIITQVINIMDTHISKQITYIDTFESRSKLARDMLTVALSETSDLNINNYAIQPINLFTVKRSIKSLINQLDKVINDKKVSATDMLRMDEVFSTLASLRDNVILTEKLVDVESRTKLGFLSAISRSDKISEDVKRLHIMKLKSTKQEQLPRLDGVKPETANDIFLNMGGTVNNASILLKAFQMIKYADRMICLLTITNIPEKDKSEANSLMFLANTIKGFSNDIIETMLGQGSYAEVAEFNERVWDAVNQMLTIRLILTFPKIKCIAINTEIRAKSQSYFLKVSPSACERFEFSCGTEEPECLDYNKYCDDEVDCSNGADEKFCDYAYKTCRKFDQVHCPDEDICVDVSPGCKCEWGCKNDTLCPDVTPTTEVESSKETSEVSKYTTRKHNTKSKASRKSSTATTVGVGETSSGESSIETSTSTEETDEAESTSAENTSQKTAKTTSKASRRPSNEITSKKDTSKTTSGKTKSKVSRKSSTATTVGLDETSSEGSSTETSTSSEETDEPKSTSAENTSQKTAKTTSKSSRRPSTTTHHIGTEPASSTKSKTKTKRKTKKTDKTTAITSEHGNTTRRCKPDEFECPDWNCIPISQVCDGHRDCRDGSDERFCASKKPPRCEYHQYACQEGGCINNELLCDGNRDCRLGDDEHDCELPASRRCTDFNLCTRKCITDICEHWIEECLNITMSVTQCADGTCFNTAKLCKEKPNCKDESDRKYCNNNLCDVISLNNTIEAANGFKDDLDKYVESLHDKNRPYVSKVIEKWWQPIVDKINEMEELRQAKSKENMEKLRRHARHMFSKIQLAIDNIKGSVKIDLKSANHIEVIAHALTNILRCGGPL